MPPTPEFTLPYGLVWSGVVWERKSARDLCRVEAGDSFKEQNDVKTG